MGNLYGKNKVLYARISSVKVYHDSLIIKLCSGKTPLTNLYFKISKNSENNENIQKISENSKYI